MDGNKTARGKKETYITKKILKVDSCCVPNHNYMATLLGISPYPIPECPKNLFHLGPQATADFV